MFKSLKKINKLHGSNSERGESPKEAYVAFLFSSFSLNIIIHHVEIVLIICTYS